MDCKFCGANIEDGSIICPECGKSLAEETPAEETVETTETNETEEVAEAAESADTFSDTEDIPEYEADEEGISYSDDDEYTETDEDVTDLEAIDGAEADFSDIFEDDEFKPAKATVILKLIAALVAVAVIISGAFFLYSRVTAPETNPLVYTTKVGDDYGVYVFKDTMKEAALLSTTGNSLYKQNTDFVMNSERIYYINNDSALFYFDFDSNKAGKIADNAEKASLVMSSDSKKLLYAIPASDASGYDLYLYNSKTSEKISKITSVSVESGVPCYGFSRSSDNSIWFVDIKKDTLGLSNTTDLTPEEVDLLNGTLFVKQGKSEASEYQTNVSAVKYFDIEGQVLVYTVQKPFNTETYSTETLYLKEASNEPEVIIDNFYLQTFLAVNKPEKGIVYMSDAIENDSADENYSFTSSYNLMFKPFGKEAITVDSDITFLYNAQYLASSVYNSYDYSFCKDSEDILLYIKGGKLMLTGDLSVPSEDSALNFSQSSAPIFSKKMDKVAYLSEEGTLFCRPMTNGVPGVAAQIAEKVSSFDISNDGSKIIFATAPDGENPANSTINIYNTKNGKTQKIASDAYPLVYFSVDQKSVYYIDNFNAQVQTANLNEYKNGKHTVIKEDIANFMTSETDVPYIISMPEIEDDAVSTANPPATIYTFKNPKNIIEIGGNVIRINAY